MAAGPAGDELASLLESYITRLGAAPASGGGAKGSASAPTVAPGEDDWRFNLLRSVGEECQTEEDLRSLLKRRPDFILYDGFEPSGRMHIAQGVFKACNVNKCTKAGGTFIFWVADWFALMNDKMGGDLEKIKTVGKYLIEVWTAGGMDMSRVKFLWSSDEISNNAKNYWLQALDIARLTSLPRIKKCCQIMGRAEDKLTAAQIMYPIMQCTDIFFLKADICQLGVDQRKVNMLARDYCDFSKRKEKPIILSHHMLYGLKAGQAKMSKSDPDSAIFMEDKAEDVVRKIRNAYCPTKPEKVAERAADDEMSLVKDDLMNPCLDYVQYILFSAEGYSFKCGGKSYGSFPDVKEAFVSGVISESQLKDTLIEEVNALLEPVRKHFETDKNAKELLSKITQWKKEDLTVTQSAARLKVLDPKCGPVFVVFAPMPSEMVLFEYVLGTLARLRQAPAKSQSILWLEDWSAFALGRFGGNMACIKAFYELLLGACNALAPELMKGVRVCWQEEMILKGPSEYWICVINAGRRLNLETIRQQLPKGATLQDASQVFTGLMHIGDVFSLVGDSTTTLCCDGYHENLHVLAKDQCKEMKLAEPAVKACDLEGMRLYPPGEGFVEVDANIMVTDKDLDVNRKLKKSFCEIGNVDYCPAITWIGELLLYKDEVVVTRKPENGGDKTYKKASDVQTDFVSGSLHPNDMKPALSKLLNGVMEPVRKAIKDTPNLTKAHKEIENYIKASQKKK